MSVSSNQNPTTRMYTPLPSLCFLGLLSIVFIPPFTMASLSNIGKTMVGAEQGRQLIVDLYNNFSSSSSSSSSNPVDLVFVLDRSASVSQSGWQSILRFVQTFLEHFTVDSRNTRVAIISYGSRASIDIDGVSRGNYNKCELVARIQRQMSKKVPSGYSATHDAILRAVDVVVNSRQNAKKAVIVITDGKSNIGPPPVRASVKLRSLVWETDWDSAAHGPQLQVYALGIQDAYMPEVRTIASPLPNHTFYIPTFETFAELARSLHDDSQSENWQVQSDIGLCHGVCHQHALCTCGTRSGNYLCVCKAGYQGDGMNCVACPRGTYKTSISPSRCVTCPANSTTLVPGAAHANHCVCQPPLYQDEAGQPCDIRHCDDLPSIANGHKFNVLGKVMDEVPDSGQVCQNVADTSCHYRCEPGYHLNGHPGLVCYPNGSWIGTVPTCQIVDCGQLNYHSQEVEKGKTTYINSTTTYQSVLEVECFEGYQAFGDTIRTCTRHGIWSGTKTWCVEIRCPALLLTPGLIITPADCGEATQPSGTECQLICESGYVLSGPDRMLCTESGGWDTALQPSCRDNEPPSITCPDDITTPVTTNNFALIHWDVQTPLATDNSGDVNVKVVGVSENPLRLTSGLHQIKYLATDKTGNQAYCIQDVTVVAFTIHVVTCPQDLTTYEMGQHLHEVTWPDVEFADNNNQSISHRCTPANGTLLPPGVYNVKCVPVSDSHQEASCQFKALLKQPKCTIPPPPAHGGISCSPTESSIQTCIPHCNAKYDFYSIPQMVYVCDLNGNWRLRSGHFWPDCSRKYYPRKAVLKGQAKYFYYEGNCEEVKALIAQKFTNFIEEQAWNVCGAESCSVDKVEVFCGSDSKRKKRNTEIKPFTDKKIKSIEDKVSRSQRKFDPLEQTSDHGGKNKLKPSEGFPDESQKWRYFHDAYWNLTKNHFRLKRSEPNNQSSSNTEAGTSNEKILERENQPDTNETVVERILYVEKRDNKKQNKATDIFNDNLYTDGFNGEIISDDDYYTDQLLNVTDGYNYTEFLDWVTDDDFNKSLNNNEVEILFQVKSELPEETFEVLEQGVILENLTAIHRQLTESLPSYNLNLGNTTDLPGNTSNRILLPDQHQLSVPTMDNCDEGYVTSIVLFVGTQACVACPAGFYYDSRIDECQPCLIGFYQEKEAQLSCLPCPENTMTELTGANKMSQCLALCGPGQYSSTGLAPCHLCPLHTIQPMNSATACMPCPRQKKTLTEGSKDIEECLDLCQAGKYSESGIVPCRPCPIGTFQPDIGATDCLLCGDRQTTFAEGATNVSDCLEWDACLETQLDCQNHGQCTMANHAAVCECAPGFSGRVCEVNLPDCFDTSCQNNGTCEDGVNEFTCICQPGFTGLECEVNVDECKSSPCLNGGSCLDGIGDFYCYCHHGWTGSVCQTKIVLCEEETCFSGHCVEEDDETFSCVCDHGYAGPSCNMTYDLCSSHPCVHFEECLSTPGHFTCLCLPGFTGTLCDTMINHCMTYPCSRGSTCIPSDNGYLCKCPGGVSGAHCNEEASSDFDLVFNIEGPEGQYVVFPPEFMPSLTDFAVCAWLRPRPLSAFATIVTLTLPRPSLTFWGNDYYIADRVEYDIIFALEHTEKLIIHIFDKSIPTNVTLIPFVWSHLCVMWESHTGHWSVTLNGTLANEGTEGMLMPGIPHHTSLILGQHNPYHAEASKLWDVYVGEITQFNVYDHTLSAEDVAGLANQTVCNKTFGDVIRWTDVLMYTKGDLLIRTNSFCLDINECLFPSIFPCANNRVCLDLQGSYNCTFCNYGYKGDDCSQSDDECLYDVCGDGDCIDGPEPYDFQCVCPPGYTGLNCHVMLNMCNSMPCQNEGTCTPQPNSYTCDCVSPHMGPNCERPASACHPNPCVNQGICSEMATGSMFECSCPEDFKGLLCETRRDWCEENHCYNGGTCRNHTVLSPSAYSDNSHNLKSCQCAGGWMGRQCDIRMAPSCDLSPCINGGSCVPLPESDLGYICQCPSVSGAHWGDNCEFLNPCDLSPCPDQTVCVLLANQTFICLCSPGSLCEPWTPSAEVNQTVSNHSFPHITDKKVPDPDILPTWALAVCGSTAVIVLVLVVIFLAFFVHKKKRKGGHGVILNNISDVAMDHVTNAAFEFDDNQTEESTYAELSDGYSLPQDNSDAENLGLSQSSQGSIKSTNLERAVSRKVSSTSLCSFSSICSARTETLPRLDETNKPLLQDIYLEPISFSMESTNDSSLERLLDKDSKSLLPRSSYTNVAFNPDDYIITDQVATRSATGCANQLGNETEKTQNKGDKANTLVYVNDNEQGQVFPMSQREAEKPGDRMGCGSSKTDGKDRGKPGGVGTAGKYLADETSAVGNSYVNMKSLEKDMFSNGPSSSNLSYGKKTLTVENPGYVSNGSFHGKSTWGGNQFKFLAENTSVGDKKCTGVLESGHFSPISTTFPPNSNASASQKAYVHLADMWYLRQQQQAFSSSHGTGDASHTSQDQDMSIAHRSQDQDMARMPSPQTSVPLKVGIPVTQSHSKKSCVSIPSQIEKTERPVKDSTLIEESRSGQEKKMQHKSGISDGHPQNFLNPKNPLINKELTPDFIPEYVELLPDDVLKLSLSKLALSKPGKRPSSLPSDGDQTQFLSPPANALPFSKASHSSDCLSQISSSKSFSPLTSAKTKPSNQNLSGSLPACQRVGESLKGKGTDRTNDTFKSLSNRKLPPLPKT